MVPKQSQSPGDDPTTPPNAKGKGKGGKGGKGGKESLPPPVSKNTMTPKQQKIYNQQDIRNLLKQNVDTYSFIFRIMLESLMTRLRGYDDVINSGAKLDTCIDDFKKWVNAPMSTTEVMVKANYYIGDVFRERDGEYRDKIFNPFIHESIKQKLINFRLITNENRQIFTTVMKTISRWLNISKNSSFLPNVITTYVQRNIKIGLTKLKTDDPFYYKRRFVDLDAGAFEMIKKWFLDMIIEDENEEKKPTIRELTTPTVNHDQIKKYLLGLKDVNDETLLKATQQFGNTLNDMKKQWYSIHTEIAYVNALGAHDAQMGNFTLTSPLAVSLQIKVLQSLQFEITHDSSGLVLYPGKLNEKMFVISEAVFLLVRRVIMCLGTYAETLPEELKIIVVLLAKYSSEFKYTKFNDHAFKTQIVDGRKTMTEQIAVKLVCRTALLIKAALELRGQSLDTSYDNNAYNNSNDPKTLLYAFPIVNVYDYYNLAQTGMNEVNTMLGDPTKIIWPIITKVRAVYGFLIFLGGAYRMFHTDGNPLNDAAKKCFSRAPHRNRIALPQETSSDYMKEYSKIMVKTPVRTSTKDIKDLALAAKCGKLVEEFKKGDNGAMQKLKDVCNMHETGVDYIGDLNSNLDQDEILAIPKQTNKQICDGIAKTIIDKAKNLKVEYRAQTIENSFKEMLANGCDREKVLETSKLACAQTWDRLSRNKGFDMEEYIMKKDELEKGCNSEQFKEMGDIYLQHLREFEKKQPKSIISKVKSAVKHTLMPTRPWSVESYRENLKTFFEKQNGECKTAIDQIFLKVDNVDIDSPASLEGIATSVENISSKICDSPSILNTRALICDKVARKMINNISSDTDIAKNEKELERICKTNGKIDQTKLFEAILLEMRTRKYNEEAKKVKKETEEKANNDKNEADEKANEEDGFFDIEEEPTINSETS